MPVIRCSHCGLISKIESDTNCVGCNRFVSAATQRPELPAFLKSWKIVGGIFAVVFCIYAMNTLFAWKAERQKQTHENNQAELFKNLTDLQFDNNEVAVENAMKVLPVKFNYKLPDVDVLRTDLEPVIANKTHVGDKIEQRDNGIQQVTKKVSSDCGPVNRGKPSTFDSDVDVTVYTCGNGGREGKFTVSERQIDTFTVRTRSTFSILDLKVLDYYLVKTANDKLICFVRYELKTGLYQNSSKTPGSFAPRETERKKEPQGQKVSEETKIENALYELYHNTWFMRSLGITDIEKMAKIDDVKINGYDASRF